ncbi:GLIPR1-like protein 1 [Neopsephotus bourkii]|uniref:GLIPR1-like protein 1 n=1 Tax=Neopsephotus bourkii TaxID=309878 RepID=UPI002AA5A7A7|nr:GLIPR1-like protein 1 [Neopsephotus bourkii]
MRPWEVVLILWVVLRPAAGQQPFLPAITDTAFIKEYVSVHNEFRSKVQPEASNMQYMTWDAALARTARAWARKCVFEHNVYLTERYQCHPSFTSVGENIWIGSVQAFNVTGVIKSWYDEVAFYDFNVNACSKFCGHYLQVVWDYSYKIGCAVAPCNKVGGIRNAANFVCNYAPSGNLSRRPYIEGRACSHCANGDTCENKLCRNTERDKLTCTYYSFPLLLMFPSYFKYILQVNLTSICLFIDYSGWRPAWEFSITCDKDCVSLVVLRIVLLVLAFACVYFMRDYFRDMPINT